MSTSADSARMPRHIKWCHQLLFENREVSRTGPNPIGKESREWQPFLLRRWGTKRQLSRVLPIEIVKLFDSTLAGVAFEERPSALPVASFRSVSDEFNPMAVDAGAAVRTMGQREEEKETLSMKILVTGSSGHLGEALIRTLRNKDCKVIGADLVPSEFTNEVGSIVDRHFVQRCMENVEAVIHTATLHKPHVLTHSRQSFVDSNITGTLNLLEEAALAGVGSFVFTSTTSAFGSALTPPPRRPAAWVTEEVTPMPRNIYGVTKTAAEDLCALFHRNLRLPCLILRTSRFFPEEDDREETRQTYDDGNVKVNEFLYRRIDLEDVVSAHLLAIEKAPFIGFGRYIVSATTPFTQDDMSDLRSHAPLVLKRRIPDYEAEYARRGWKMFPGIDRVYVNERARNDLGWQPQYDFKYVLDRLRAGADPRSPLSRAVGSKGYHSRKFAEGPYPAE